MMSQVIKSGLTTITLLAAISGSAILPNPARNKSWTAYLQAKEEKFSKSVRALKL